MTSEPTGRTTKYSLLTDVLRDQISRGNLRPDDRLPSIGELRAQYECSQATVVRALEILEAEGLLVRINGKGVFVAEPPKNRAETAGTKPLLGLVLPNCRDGFFSQIIEGVEVESRAAGYNLLVANSHGSRELEAGLLKQLAGQTRGLCLMPTETGNISALSALLDQSTPFVLIDRRVAGLDVPVIATDNERGGYLATRHLLESGCGRVYVIGESSERISSLRDRIVGFRKALTEQGVPFEPSLVRQADDEPARLGYLLTKELIDSGTIRAGDSRTGIFALNEGVAHGCYVALREGALKIPRHVAVVAFDDLNATLFDPPLTSIRQDLTGMGSKAVVQLVNLIRNGGKAKARPTRLKPELIVRGSSVPDSGFSQVSQVLQDARVSTWA